MTDDSTSTHDFGCDRCWPAAPDAAWNARALLSRVAMPIDDSHSIVSILECPSCAQRFVSVFFETVDWVGGDDSQYWKLMPITVAEAESLAQQGDSLTEADVAALGPGRRSLRRDYPSGAEPRIYWSPETRSGGGP